MIIVIVGGSGIGKTKLSIELAQKYQAIVLNADSMQIYKNLNIGTAKITEEEKKGIPHYLFDIKEVTDDYTVYDYQKDGRKILNENKNKNIIIVGGTGLYIKALLYDYEFIKEKTQDLSYLSLDELYNLCLKKDANLNIPKNNRHRLERFLQRKETYNKDKLLYKNVYFIGLISDREKLYNVANARVEKMFDDGLLNEVKYFYTKKIQSKALLTGIGYKELYDYFDNKISLEEAKELIKKRTRHYIKRQYTWFRNQMNIEWFDVNFTDFSLTVNKIINYLETLDK